MAHSARPATRPVPVGAIARDVGARLAEGSGDVPVTGVTLDSRAVTVGDLFAALPGRHTHGAAHVGGALDRGAVAVLTDAAGAAMCAAQCAARGAVVLVADDPRAVLGEVAALVHGHPARDLRLVGVTGTNGKTTVATMVAGGLAEAGESVGVIGTLGVTYADVRLPGARTTPEAPDLMALFAAMAAAGVRSVVMEVSSIALVEHRVDGVTYDLAAFTNLSQDHLDYHGSMAAYASAKSSLFTREHAGFGLIGIDDEWGRGIASGCRIPYETWSIRDPEATWTVDGQGTGEGVRVVGPGTSPTDIALALPGSFNVANAVCAFAALRHLDVDARAASTGIARARVPGRMEVVGESRGITGIVDYAHTPDAITRVIEALRATSPGRLVVVVGAGGDRDAAKRPLMGRAASLADVVVVTDDNPRSEDPDAIRAEVLAGVTAHRVQEVADRRSAIAAAIDAARAGDIVVVLGKGHEQGQEVGGVVAPFDDATELASALAAREGAVS